MKVQGVQITRVNKTAVQSSNNIAITMSNGDVHWVNMKYCNAILSSLFLDGASPDALEGSTVSYEKRVHKAGDTATNEDGSVAQNAGKDVKFSKDGYRVFAFRVEEKGAKAAKLGEVGFKMSVKHSLKGQLSNLSLKKDTSGIQPVAGTDTSHGAIEQRDIANAVGLERKEITGAASKAAARPEEVKETVNADDIA